MKHRWNQPWRWLSGAVSIALLLGACVAPATLPNAPDEATEAMHEEEETLPELSPVALNGGKLRVVATTNLVGDAVAQIGGDHIELTTLLAPGTDPHAYQLAPADRQLLEDAQVIFINGLGLEEGMLPVLDDLENGAPVVAVSIGISTIEFGGHEEKHTEAHEGEEEDAEEDEGEEGHHHEHEGADPHIWQSVPNVIVWTENIAHALSALDPAQADAYATAAADYRKQLEALNNELHALVDTLPAEQRKLVTDHDSLGYLAHEYGFTVVGTVIPS
jgi:zinc/manganese transport system substrate-binding protein